MISIGNYDTLTLLIRRGELRGGGKVRCGAALKNYELLKAGSSSHELHTEQNEHEIRFGVLGEFCLMSALKIINIFSKTQDYSC